MSLAVARRSTPANSDDRLISIEVQSYDFSSLPLPSDYNDVLIRLVSSHNIASKRWVFEQYDSMVRTNTVAGPGSDAAVIRIRHTSKALALATDCNARYCYLNPRLGAQIAVAESARNCVCSGARPTAITNCLNFGNPYKPEMYYMFAEAVAGMGEACRVLETPVTGGNVSFYNEDPERAVYPTPTIGMLGIIDDIAHITTSNFKIRWRSNRVWSGTTKNELGGSEYVKEIHGLVTGNAPSIDLDFEKRLQRFILEAIKNDLVKSAHDISEGGLAVALAECCFGDREHLLGAKVNFKLDLRCRCPLFRRIAVARDFVNRSGKQRQSDSTGRFNEHPAGIYRRSHRRPSANQRRH